MKYIILILVFISPSVFADQLTYTELNRVSSDNYYYGSQDRRLQYNHGEDKYLFLSYEQMSVCPYYCGFMYSLYGLGFGVKHNLGSVKLFAQAGYYIIKNSIESTKYNENLYYYLNQRFSSGSWVSFDSYEVKNDNSPGISMGMEIPYNDNFSFVFGYRYLKIKETITGYFNPEKTRLWWDPVNRDMSSYFAGVSFNWR